MKQIKWSIMELLPNKRYTMRTICHSILLVSFTTLIYAIDFKTTDCNKDDGVYSVSSHSYFTSSVTDETTPCRSISSLTLPENVNYDVYVTLQSMRNSTPGIFFNIRDERNFDMLFFRPNEKVCLISASYINAQYKESRKQKCPDIVNHRSFYVVTMRVGETTYNITINEMGPFTFQSQLLRRPSLGFIQGLEYKYLCKHPCEFNFKSLALIPDTTPDMLGIDGLLVPPKELNPGQLHLYRIDLQKLGRDADKFCSIAVYFRKINVGSSKIYINGVSNFTQGKIKFYITREVYHDIFFHLDDSTTLQQVEYSISFQVMGCNIPKPELSFICHIDNHLRFNESDTCYRGVDYHTQDTELHDFDPRLAMGWYDIGTCVGKGIPTKSPGRTRVCGSRYPVWHKPPPSGIQELGLTNGTACVYSGKRHECTDNWDLPMYKCEDKVLYYLTPTPMYTGYCAGDVDPCDRSINLTAISGVACKTACEKMCREDLSGLDTAGTILGIFIILVLAAGVVTIITAIVIAIRRRYRRHHIRFHYKKTASEEDVHIPLHILHVND